MRLPKPIYRPSNRHLNTCGRRRTPCRGRKLKSANEYRAYCKSGNKPDDIPTHPHIIYADSGWISWGDWLGNHNRSANMS
jgi:hypothetical protein